MWLHGRASLTGSVDSEIFHDNLVLVPVVLSPVVGLTDSVHASRIAHWIVFVLPGPLVVSWMAQPAGRVAMTVTFMVLLLNRYHIGYASTHVTLGQGLSSWGLIAIYCFVSGKWQPLGLSAMVIATLCKYQAIVVCLVLLTCSLACPAATPEGAAPPLASATPAGPVGAGAVAGGPPPCLRAQARQAKRQLRAERYDRVRQLRRAGRSLRQVARETGLSTKCVICYLRAEHCPDWGPGRQRPTQVYGRAGFELLRALARHAG